MIGLFRVGSVVLEMQKQKANDSKYRSFAVEKDDNIFELNSFTGIHIKFCKQMRNLNLDNILWFGHVLMKDCDGEL